MMAEKYVWENKRECKIIKSGFGEFKTTTEERDGKTFTVCRVNGIDGILYEKEGEFTHEELQREFQTDSGWEVSGIFEPHVLNRTCECCGEIFSGDGSLHHIMDEDMMCELQVCGDCL